MDAYNHIDIIQNLTDTYRQYQYAEKSERELQCLKQQIPAALRNPLPDDFFVGRHQLPAIGFALQEYGVMGGLGYYINHKKIAALRDALQSDRKRLNQLDDLVRFWQCENTACKVRAAYTKQLSAALPSDHWTEDSGVAFPLYRLAGSMLDYKTLLQLGIGGLRQKINRYDQGKSLLFYKAALGALDLFESVCHHYIKRIKAQGNQALPHADEIIKMLETLSLNKPQTLRQAIQLMFLYNTLSGSLNYGRMDDYLGDFLQSDLDNNRISRPEAKKYLLSLWRLMIARDTPTDGRVIIGGRGRKNEKAADEVALLAIEASMELGDVLPQLSLRVYDGQNPLLLQRALKSIARGNTFPILYNDDVNIEAVQKAFNLPKDKAERYVPFGCGEYVIDGQSFGTPSGVLNLLKALEVTLFNGYDIIAQKPTGLQSSSLTRFQSFDAFFRAYKNQVRYYIEKLAQQQAIEYKVAAENASFLFASVLYSDCIETGKPLLDGGISYLGGTLETYGNTNTADSLLAIRKKVFEEKSIAANELVTILENNFKDYEKERHQLMAVAKYGNDDKEADEMVQAVNDFVCETAKVMSAKVGLHSYLVVNINNSANAILGRKTAASADGREAFTPMANGNSASPGSDHKGLTAYLNSISKPTGKSHAGFVQNLKLSPKLFEDHFDKLQALLQSYFCKGGSQLMINLVSNSDLRKAMQHPEAFSNLIVRVGGFSARFIDLDHDVQMEILNRTSY